MTRKLLLILASCLFALAAQAGMQEGYSAYNEGNYAVALKEFRKMAAKGNQGGQFYLGLMYANGQGVPKDEKAAAVWYEKSAKQGYAGAQFNLGNLYHVGAGVPKDDKKAVYWFEQAASQNLPDAQFALGLMYAMGTGVEAKPEDAVKWYRKAADQGYAPAQYNLGVLSREGKEPDLKAAADWFEKAATQGYVPAQFNLAYMYTEGQVIGTDYIRAYKWAFLAARTGDPKSGKLLRYLESSLTKEQVETAKAMVAEWENALNK
ncbi:MAG TPA: tetratricopeptide repeat protein [Gallionella sp.]|nr:tetratricopeptide repeat protein [Gallionella sp.]